jgi:catechol 2,3-dioxygenase|nr:MAG: glyoxalase [Acidobacteriota bacterium]
MRTRLSERPSVALPPSAHVGRVALQIADLDASLTFYRGVLGLQPIEQHEHGGQRIARLGTADGRVLVELHERPGAKPVPRRGLLGLYHFAVLLPSRADLGRFVVHAANQGQRFSGADHLFSEALYLVDPDGLQVEVYRDVPREDWVYRDGELVGDTLPLDLDGVVAAAGQTSWAAAPDGTVIGHVHHFVGDLERAHHFYVATLGLEPTVTSFPGALFVSAGGYHHHVGLNIWAAGAPIADDDHARLLWWELVLPTAADVEAVAQRLETAGVTLERDGDAVLATDPWRITVRLTTNGRQV